LPKTPPDSTSLIMRKAVGDVYNQNGYFHIESFLNPGLAPWTLDQAEAHAELLKGLVVLADVELVFWMIHPRGFGLILKKTPKVVYSQEAKYEALERIGETKFAQRWMQQTDEGAKPLSHVHNGKRQYFEALSQDLGTLTKTFKQRISAAYNNQKNFVGCIWRDRAKAFHLPDDALSLSEVAAFIFAQAHLQNDEGCLEWPSTIVDARRGDSYARSGLKQILQTKASTPKQIERLLKLREVVLEKAITTVKRTSRGRGAAWRPICEQQK